ncbi:hypothetical protein C8F01DRAFT_1265938 [Mycena amicta]|nr:hypothetical protein C8F01DRAFT_1265938 [Mycena amicta]
MRWSTDRGVWDERWVKDARLEVFCGDLGVELFGLDNISERVAEEAVPWVYPYEKLQSANVPSALTAFDLASFESKQKLLVFVSSTSVMDSEHYVLLSDSLAAVMPSFMVYRRTMKRAQTTGVELDRKHASSLSNIQHSTCESDPMGLGPHPTRFPPNSPRLDIPTRRLFAIAIPFELEMLTIVTSFQ